MSGKMPKYRKHSSRDVAFVEHNGKRYYLGKYNSTASWAKYRELIAEWFEAGAVTPKTVVDLTVAFLDWAEKHYPHNGHHSDYLSHKYASKYLIQACGNVRIKDMTVAHLKGVRANVLEAGCCRNYANKVISRCNRVFRWGAAEGYVDGDILRVLDCIDPIRKGTKGVREKGEVKPVPWSHVRHTIRHLRSEVVKDIVRITWLTGARSGNVCSMKWSDVVDGRDGKWWIPGQHKNAWRGKQLTIPLGPRAIRILEKYSRDKEFIFTARSGKPYKQSQLASKIRDAAKKAIESGAPIASWSPHQIRHSRATRIRRLHGVEASQVYLGLSSISTAEIYAERSRRTIAEIASRIG